MNGYYRRDLTPVDDVITWVKSFQADGRRVARTTVTDVTDPSRRVVVSTVFLGIDHGYGGGPPVLFETMTFPNGGEDEDCERYCTESQARDGHTEMVARVAAEMTEPHVVDET